MKETWSRTLGGNLAYWSRYGRRKPVGGGLTCVHVKSVSGVTAFGFSQPDTKSQQGRRVFMLGGVPTRSSVPGRPVLITADSSQ